MNVKMLLGGAAAAVLMTAVPALPVSAQTPDDQLVIAITMSALRGFDPHDSATFESQDIVGNIYDRLVQLAEDGPGVEPMLASEWTVSDDGKLFTFTMREGAKFHSGNRVTAHDAEYSLRRLVKLGLGPSSDLTQWGFTAENVDELIRATSDSTLEIEVPEVWNQDLILYSLASFGPSIVDRKVVEENIQDDDDGRTFLQTNDAGSGAYILGTWRANDLLVAEAFSDYWGGEPEMRRVLFRHIPESSQQRLQIEQGDIDVATRLSSTDVNSLEQNEDIAIDKAVGIGYYYLALNQENEILSNPLVREAFRYVIDYEGLAGTVMQHYGNMQQTIVPAGMIGASDENPYSLDPEKARELLAEAGYPDGIEMVYYATPVTPEFEIAQSIQANAERAGIKLDLQPGDHIGDFRQRNYEVFSARWGAQLPDPHAVFSSLAVNPDNSREANLTGYMAWRAGWDVPDEIEALVEEAAHELDRDRRAELYARLNQMYLESSPPIITSFQRAEPRALRANVDGYEGRFTTWSNVSKGD